MSAADTPGAPAALLPVVVVGAGPTGVTVATLLADHGVPVLVLDRWADVFPRPRAVHLDDEVYRILDMLGVAHEFAAISRPARGLRLLDRDHRVLMEFDRSGNSPDNGHPRANMFDQPDLERLLRANAARRERVTFRGDVDVNSLTDHGTHLDVRGVDRGTGAELVWRAAYVLGCDGANSTVRTSIGSAYQDLGFEQRWLVVDVETKTELRLWEGVHQVCGAERAATYMRVGDTRHRWEFQLLDHEQPGDFGTVGDLAPLLRPWIASIPQDELRLLRVADYTFRAAIADRWRRGHVFLLGDAAHLTPPFVGQGMGAGLRDAANLGWKLAGVIGGSLPESVLDTYEAEREPHARAMIQLARATGIVMTAGGRPGDLIRRLAAPLLARIPRLPSRLVDGATPPLRRPDDGGPPRRDRLAGRLVPNAVIDGVALDSAARRSWLLVSRDPVAPRERQLLENHGCLVVHAREGRLADWLHSGRSRAALVRPDRTVHLAHPRTSVVTAAGLGVVVHGML
ncbi:bifunctional 3-(3-hydroxy-phenyl)propionate/3-hydroxycinnamic acid hydroxylase MhpA [Actinacidiphila acididurans]|uniref:Bifunctional 3-(3-hydroxy-phenyl)propionate/3-hydroxycinnamic acid hydroxylase n=1 Tax=Actinacidiphila acididurans TaxID=2784346 RepID=A0ABS2TM20_9ACTN|nr:bifunctional 3-(3-hydroxy-phenyl)propionate/3-hydroxycinnamic acid hydroxylase [Actinacidiphila acididurans]MBM9504385.1 bifunctional 3-(3-hydroxy-phenyl)propionate/3-hydroxycinnamic acid hydroxylase [Actinacidiphila acididurans]